MTILLITVLEIWRRKGLIYGTTRVEIRYTKLILVASIPTRYSESINVRLQTPCRRQSRLKYQKQTYTYRILNQIKIKFLEHKIGK